MNKRTHTSKRQVAMQIVIMAGGGGTRLWPVSRLRTPKQSQPFGDRETLLQKTFKRLRTGWAASDIFVSTNTEQYPILHRQLPTLAKRQYILEPSRRETAPAIGLAAAYLHKKNPQAIMVTANSDAYIREVPEYVAILRAAGQAVARTPDQTVLIGIKPRYPDTGLGYIKMDSQVDNIGRHEIFRVERFVEKPNLATAKRYAASWQYLWNPAMFVFRVDAMLDKFRRWLNPSYRLLMQMQAAMGTTREQAVIRRLYPKMQKISIDYGIMEKDRDMRVLPADLTWADIGNWRAVYDVLSNDRNTTVLRGKHIQRDSHGNLIHTDHQKIVATAGLSDMIIIDTPDALLIVPRDRAQDVKMLVAELEAKRLTDYL